MRNLALIIFLLIINSCVQIEKRGYSFELSDYENVKEGLSDQNSVLENMGSPSFISQINDEELWVYYGEDLKKLLFFKPTIAERKIITISFHKNGVVSKINNYDLSNDNNLHIVSDYTKVESHKKGFWSQIFGNIGQVRPN